MQTFLPPPPKRILLIRLSAFGDVVIATGLLHGLKRAHPEAEIDWLTQPEFAELLQTQAAIAQVQVWERRQWGSLFRGLRWLTLARAVWALCTRLRARRYDWVIDAQGLFKSRALARLAGGSLRIGYAGKEPGQLWLHRLVSRFPEAHAARRFIGDEHAPMLRALTGFDAAIPHIRLPNGSAQTSGIVVAPYTTRPQKHWPMKYWVSLLQLLADDGHQILVLGGPADAESAQLLTTAVNRASVVSLAGTTSFLSAAQLIAQASAVIGVDTGLTHLGFALDRPTIALLGSTRPYAASRPAHSAVMFQPVSCAPCGRHPSCGGRYDCLTTLTPENVLAALSRIAPFAQAARAPRGQSDDCDAPG